MTIPRVKTPLPSGHWINDLDDADSIDDLFVKGCDVHLERMDNGFYWIGIYVGDEVIHIDIVSRRKIKARMRR